MSEETNNENQGANTSDSSQNQNPPLRDTNTYLEKGEKIERTKKD